LRIDGAQWAGAFAVNKRNGLPNWPNAPSSQILLESEARPGRGRRLLEDLNGTFHRVRPSGIDEELFDVISGVEALSTGKAHRSAERVKGVKT